MLRGTAANQKDQSHFTLVSGKFNRNMRDNLSEFGPDSKPYASSNSSRSIGGRFLICHMCGREYGTASLPIHQKACALKQAQKVPPSKKGLKQKQSSSAADSKMQEIFEAMQRHEIHAHEFNKISAEYYETTAVDRGVKLPCHNCGRTFARQEGLEKHVVLCEKQIGNNGGVFAKKPKTSSSSNSSNSNNSLSPSEETQRAKAVSTTATKPKVKVEGAQPKTAAAEQKITTETAPKALMTMKSSYCIECGENFSQFTNSAQWKFCPACGTKRAY